ncbi:hypothetical protein EON64_01490 [archaeon]|nr:MAG: hypothetical protein EON64_01490 [archaeon]
MLRIDLLSSIGLDVRLANNKFVVQGLPSSSFFLLSVQQDTPDSVGIVQDVVIKRTLFEEGSVIHATIHVRGTRLFALQDGQMTPYTSPSPFLDRPPADDSSSGVKIITMEMRFKVTCRVALDSNFFITKLQHEAYPLSPPLMPSGMPL